MRRTATVGAVIALALAMTGCSGPTTPDAPARSPGAAASSTPSAAPRDANLPELEELPSRRIALTKGSAPAALVATTGAVWVQAHRAAELTRIDNETETITAVVDTGGHLGCGDLTYAAESVWFTGCGVSPGLVRVDVSTAEVTEVLKVDGLGPAELEGRLWIGDWEDGAVHLNQFETTTPSSVAADLPVPGLLDTGGGVAVASGTLWTADMNAAIAYRVDPASGVVTAAVPIPLRPDTGYLISHDDAVWYTDLAQGALVRIDPATGDTRVLETRTEQPDEYWGIAASSAEMPGRLWVRSGDSEIWLVDTRNDVVERRIHVVDGSGGDVVQVGDSLWVSSFATDEVEVISLSG